jgi:hypothetical protein
MARLRALSRARPRAGLGYAACGQGGGDAETRGLCKPMHLAAANRPFVIGLEDIMAALGQGLGEAGIRLGHDDDLRCGGVGQRPCCGHVRGQQATCAILRARFFGQHAKGRVEEGDSLVGGGGADGQH